MAVMRVRAVATLVVSFNFFAAFFTLKRRHGSSQQDTTANNNNLRVKGYILKQPSAWSFNGVEPHQRRSKSILEKAAYSWQPRDCPLDSDRRSCLLVLQSDSRLGFPHRRLRPNLRHIKTAWLQLMLLLQILYHGFRETSRLILRTRLHGRRKLKPNPENHLRLRLTRHCPHSSPCHFHNPRVRSNKDCSVSAPPDSSILQR